MRRLAAALLLALTSCSGCKPQPPPPPHGGPRWCDAVGDSMTRSNVRCLELAGSFVLGRFGPEVAPKRNSVDLCLPLADLGLQSNDVGNYETSYKYDGKFKSQTGLDLQKLTGLGWVPNLKADLGGETHIDVSVKLLEARWRSVSDVGAHVTQRVQALRYDSSAEAQQAYQSCLEVKHNLCAPGVLFPEEVLEARPVIVIKTDRKIDFASQLGTSSIGLDVQNQSDTAGTVTVTWTAPLVIGARTNRAAELMGTHCAQD